MGAETSETRDVPTEQNWGALRTRIVDLYLHQNKSLIEVLQILSEEDNFKASSSQLKRRLKTWGLSKNLSSHQMEEIAQTLMRTNEEALTKRSSDKEVAKVNGQSVSLSKVKRYQKRRQIPLMQKGPTPILPMVDTSTSTTTTTVPVTTSEKETYGLNYDWLEEDDELSIPIRPGLEFRNLFEDFVPLQFPSQPATTSSSLSLSQRPCYVTGDFALDSDDPMEQPSKRRRSQSPNPSEQDGRMLACPFYKKDPARYSEKSATEPRYRSCVSAYLTDISRLKQHLYRLHRAPDHQCSRCHKIFSSYQDHNRHRAAELPCPVLDRNPRAESGTDLSSDLMSREQLEAIKIRRRGKRQDEQWYEIFQILFPGEPLPASPYPGDGGVNENEAIDHFVRFFKIFSTAMPSESQRRYLLPMLPDHTRRIVESAIAQTLSPSENGDVSMTTWLPIASVPHNLTEPSSGTEHGHFIATSSDMPAHRPTLPPPPPFQSMMEAAQRPIARQNWNIPLDWGPVWGTASENAMGLTHIEPMTNNFIHQGP